MAVAGGDFSADSLVSLAELSLQDKVRTEKHGTKNIALIKRYEKYAEEYGDEYGR